MMLVSCDPDGSSFRYQGPSGIGSVTSDQLIIMGLVSSTFQTQQIFVYSNRTC